MSYVYLITSSNAVKIGVSNNPQKRLATLQTANHEPLRLFFEIRCSSDELAYKVESCLHERYSTYRLNGEWFMIDPNIAVNEIIFAVNLASALTGRNWWRNQAVETPDYALSHHSEDEIEKEPFAVTPRQQAKKALAYVVLLAITTVLTGALINDAPLTLSQISAFGLSGFYAIANLR
jgi:hypothetical protein